MENRGKKENELIIFHNEQYDYDKTIDFFKLKLLDMFQKYDVVVISCIKKYLGIANTVIEETKHMGFLEYETRKVVKEKGRNSPYKEVEYWKITIELIPSVVALKKDRERKIIRDID